MDEEELEQPKNKITLSNFFESIQSIDELANNALSITNSNSNLLQEQKSLIDALSLSIEGLRGDIQEVNNYITIQKNEASDKLVETQDDKQKQMISERLQGLQGEKGEKGEEGEAAQLISESESKKFKEEAEEKRQLKKFVNEVIDEREEKKENERKDELREKEDAEQKKEQSERLQNKSEGGLKASVGGLGTFDEGRSTGGQGGQGGGKKKGGLLGLLTNPLALGIGVLGAGASLLQLPKMLTSMVGASFGGGRGIGGAADFLTGGLFDFDGRSGGGALKKMGKGLKNMFSGKKKEENVKAEVDNLESRVDALESGDPSSKDSGKIVTTKKLKTRFDRDTGKAYVNGQEVDVQKYAEFKRLSPREQLNQGLDFFNEDPISPTEGMNEKGLKPEKKENKLMDFVKKGGVAGFLGRKLFGGKKDGDKEEKDLSKKGKVEKTGTGIDASESGSGVKDLLTQDRKLGIEIQKALKNGDKDLASQLSKRRREIRNKIKGKMMDPSFSNTFRKELYSGSEKSISSEKKDRRGIKGIIGGVADSLTGGFFDFDKRGDTKLQEFQQGTADTLTGGFFDFDKKGNNKFQDFQQGTADTLTGGVFDFDKKGSNKLQRFQQGFADAMTGNLTDFDRKGGKTVGATRTVTGMADFFTGNMFDLDKRGEFNFFGKGKGKDKGFGEKTGSHYGEDGSVYHHYPLDQPRVKNMGEAQEYLKNNPEAKGRPWVKFGDYYVLQTEEQANQDRERLEKAAEGGSKYAQSLLDFEGSEDNIKPVIESKDKNISQESLTSLDTSSPQIIMMPGANQESSTKNVIAPNNPPQVKEGELKSTSSSSSFVNTISNNIIVSAKKSKSGLPPEIARMIK